ncbi:YhdP family protein [Campylobacter sp. 2014D-0216]|uniref:YhdP family protein n=1 Tax=Campylobacter sp. 2014D-0216 TaxID=1813595 RepID=UPI0018A67F60|nr:AsmA-like C-terminal domain-containing protein [Campylobacter sp. 2014D-0216]QOR00508.1 AsmA-like C-terminal domain-containing protein [Campylobacter sp. 2014D-0216]
MDKRKIKTKSQHIKKILKFLALPIIFFIALFIYLKNGIYIEKIEIASINLEKLYIKLDKKLILNAKKVTINSHNQKGQNDTSASKAIKIIKDVKYLYWFFQEVSIGEILVNNYPVEFVYKNDLFFVNGEDLLIKLNLKVDDKKIQVDVSNFLLKDYGLNVMGTLMVNPKTKFYTFRGKLESDFLKSDVKFSLKREEIAYELKNISTNNISKIFHILTENGVKLPTNLDLWVGGKVKADFYFIEELNGFADFGKHRYYLDDIKAKGYVNNLRVVLDKGIDPIVSPFVRLDFAKQRLDFSYDKLYFNSYNLAQSKVYITNMLNDKAGIDIHLKSNNTRADYRVNQILRLYDIKLPFLQNNGITKTDLTLKIPFEHPEKLTYRGNFDIVNSNINISDFKIIQANVNLEKDKVKINNARVQSKLINGDFNASVNLKQKKGEFKTYIISLKLPQDSLKIEDKFLNLDLDFDHNISLYNKELTTTLFFDQGFSVYVAKLAKYKEYSSLMQKNNVHDGELSLKTVNFDDFDVDINNTTFESFLLYKDNNPYEYDSFSVNIKGDDFNLTSASGSVLAQKESDDVNITLNNVNLLISQNDTENTLSDLEGLNYYINAKNIDLILKDFNKTLDFDQFSANVKKDFVKAQANRGESKFNFLLKENQMQIRALKMDDDFLNTFMRQNAFEKGEFNLYIDGNSTDFFKGKFLFKDTYLKDLKFHQQLLSFIDTIPSLLLFKAPTFNEKGFSIENAGVSFSRKKDLFEIDALNFNGDSADILGQAKVNLRSGQVDGLLELRTLKSASSVISKVPIINQIILGKDRQISTQIKLGGTLDNPEFKTQLIAQSLQLPYHLIKNIFELPANLVK